MKTFYVIEWTPYYLINIDGGWPTWRTSIEYAIKFKTEKEALDYQKEHEIKGEVIEHAYED